MRDFETIIGTKANTAIEANGFFVPANSFALYIAEFCEPALFHVEGLNEYSMSKGGSAFRVKIYDRFFAISTHHQISIGKYGYDQFCLCNMRTQTLITSERAIFAIGGDEILEEYDFVMFEFTDPVKRGLLNSTNWYNIILDLNRMRTPDPLIAVTIGYPGQLNSIDYESFKYDSQALAVWGRQVPPSITGRLAFSPLEGLKTHPSGMSGAPVFGLTDARNGMSCFLAGLLTEGTKNKFHFLPLARIAKNLLEALN